MTTVPLFAPPLRIGILVFDGFEPIDVWGFTEAFTIARFVGTAYDDANPRPFDQLEKHRPRGHSADSKWPDPGREPPPIRFNSLSRQPALACTRVRGQNAPGSGRLGPMNRPKIPDPGPTAAY